MTKLLIAILLLVAGFKLVANTQAVGYQYDLASSAEQEEEEKQEIKEQGKSKYSTEDKYYFFNVANPAFLWTSAISSTTHFRQDVYIGFVGKPITPPPNMV